MNIYDEIELLKYINTALVIVVLFLCYRLKSLSKTNKQLKNFLFFGIDGANTLNKKPNANNKPHKVKAMKEEYTPQFNYDDIPEQEQATDEEPPKEYTPPEEYAPPKKTFAFKGFSSLKDKLVIGLGTFGVILYFLVSLALLALPIAIIKPHFIIVIIFSALEVISHNLTIGFWIWGLIVAINGAQTVWTIIYYIVFSILWVFPFIGNLISYSKN